MAHRIFFGIRPPSNIREALLSTMVGVDRARWQDDGQLHMTLRYIGEVDEPIANDLADAASRIDFRGFDLTVSGCGVFERKGIVRTLYARVEPSEALTRLQSKLERVCRTCGLPAEGRKFHPHVTLARLNSASGPPNTFLARNSALSLGPWAVEDYILYESHLREQGSFYEPVSIYSARTQ